MDVAQVEPLDFKFIEMVCDYLQRVHDSARTKPEGRHMRLLAPRKLLVSNAVASAVSSAASGWHVDDTPISAWQWESVVLWARELAEAEVLGGTGTHVDTDYARTVRALWHPPRPVPHRIRVVKAPHGSAYTHP